MRPRLLGHALRLRGYDPEQLSRPGGRSRTAGPWNLTAWIAVVATEHRAPQSPQHERERFDDQLGSRFPASTRRIPAVRLPAIRGATAPVEPLSTHA